MELSPFEIYVSPRPLKVAFLLDPKQNSLDHLDVVLEYCHEKWGGRYHPIALTEGSQLTEQAWLMLESLDPDVVLSLRQLTGPLVEEIEHRLSPFHLKVVEPPQKGSRFAIELDEDGLSILPSVSNIRQASYVGSAVVDTVVGSDADSGVQAFVHRSLGTFSEIHAIREALKQNKVVPFEVTDIPSLARALRSVTSYRGYAYPIQLCAVPNHLREGSRLHGADHFTVFVGDAMEDVVASWNHALQVPKYLRTLLMQAWLPTSFLDITELQEPLGRWLSLQADPNGSMNKEIRFTSASLSVNQLQTRLASIMQHLSVRGNIWAEGETEIRAARNFNRPSLRPKTSIYYRGGSASEQLELSEPAVEPSWRNGEYWVADFLIQHQSQDFTNYIREFWWQFPPRNGLVQSMFNRLARVQADGLPSVLVARGNPSVRLSLRSQPALFSQLARRANAPPNRDDPREPYGRAAFADARHADKGRYFRGFVQLFGGLFPAYQVLSNRYWRNTFVQMASGTLSDEARVQAIRNRLAKELARNGAGEATQVTLERLARFVLDQARNLPHGGRESPYRRLLAAAQAEFKEWQEAVGSQGASRSFDEADFSSSLASLVEAGVMLVGVQPKCPACGYRVWRLVDEVTQHLTCKGCGSPFPLEPEAEWHYKLNSLVEAGVDRHGLLPVVLLLGQLMQQSAHSFLYDVGIELFEDVAGRPVGELDVMVVVDGRFSIGEVKQTVGLFGTEDFTRMEIVARRLRPHEVFFTSLDRDIPPHLERKITELRERLVPMRVAVNWYPLSGHIHEPAIVY